MEKTVLISLSIEELKTNITECVNDCLKNNNLNEQRHPEFNQFLNIRQAAEFLNLSIPTLYSKVSKSEIPVSKKGKRLYFSKQELLNWIKSGRKKTNEEIEMEAENYLTSNSNQRMR